MLWHVLARAPHPLACTPHILFDFLSGVGRSLGKDSKSKTHSDYDGRIFFSSFLHFFWCDPSFLINVRMVGRLSVVACCCTHVFFGAREIFEMAPGIVLDFLFRF